ncbi:DUF6702 family protein [Jejuia pallidilutea]|uniref:DUF6702 family protein n=1 Tax=Jejuia pallidilutea TaxID=504487 RepID=UPI0005AA9B60|nr:DUF6702 family protein [Jejuia pallidilutea]
MKLFKIIISLFIILSLSSFGVLHKYYVSNTQIDYVKEKKSVQIITRLFIDDFENVLKERYGAHVTFDDAHVKTTDVYVERYLGEKLKIHINGKPQPFIFIGKALDMGVAKCYLEIEDVNEINTFKITNQTLFDLFTEQQHIIKLDINSKQKSFVLTKQNDNAVLNFN